MRISVLTIIALFIAFGAAESATYYINPYAGVNTYTKAQAHFRYYAWRSVQTGIDSAAAGDTLLLADGVYMENITLTTPVVLIGNAWQICIIQGTGAGAVVTIPAGVNGCVFQQLEVNGGYSAGSGGALTGIACGAGVSNLVLNACAVVNCAQYGVQATFGAGAGIVNDSFAIEQSVFQNILAGNGGAMGSCAIWGDHLSHAVIESNKFSGCGIGIWLSASALPDSSAGTGNVIVHNVFVNMMQNAIAGSGAYNTAIADNQMRNCVEFTAPDSLWSASYPGVVAFNGAGVNVTLTNNIIRDNRGFLGEDAFFMNPATNLLEGPGYNGVPAVFIGGAFSIAVTDNSIFNNQYGGVFVSGAAAQVTMDSNYIFSNGSLNDGGKDYGLAAPSAVVTAKENWWGLNTGPAYDGSGFGNGVYGAGSLITPYLAQTAFNITYSPKTIIFNIVHVGLLQDTTFWFTNSGPGPAFTTAPFVAGGQSSQFSILQPTATQIIEPGDTLAVRMQFAPSEIGLIEGQAAVQTDSLGPLIGPNLYAFGGLAVLATADTLVFDTLAPSYCAVRTLTIANNGTEVLGVTGADVSGLDSTQFTVLDPLPIVVPQQASASIHIEYCPASIAKKTAQLILTGNTIPTFTYVQLVGYSATVSRLAATTDSIALGLRQLGHTADTAVTIVNTASVPLAIDSISFVNDTDKEFILLSPILPDTLSPGAQVQLHVQFSPQVRASKNVTLHGRCSDGTVFTIIITARAVIIQVSTAPDTLFSGITVHAGTEGVEQCARLTNTGDLPVGIVLAAIVGQSRNDYTIDGYNSGTLAPGAVDSFCIQYNPQQSGSSKGFLVIQFSDYNSLYDSIPLAGNATPTAVDELVQSGDNFTIANYPNPFAEATTISFHLALGETVNLRIYDIFGNLKLTLANGFTAAGDYHYNWKSDGLPAGVYYCRGMIGGKSFVKQMLVVK